jgi:hypothetical protein
MEISIATKTTGELKGLQFFIPSYQRGYRWTKQEVTALLEDLKEFSDDNGKRKYCLQPLVVKLLDNGKFEVVDGQQRLTTIYILIKIAADEMRSAVPPFSLEYETREDSAVFLNELTSSSPSSDGNIDYFYISAARDEMVAWLDKQSDKSLMVMELYRKVLSSTFFIWYELPEDSDAISMFAKINLGKIPLTSAELIKALIMSKENFENGITKRQVEISTAWDRIEQGLRDDSFWYFINQQEKSGTRIDLIFELIAEKHNADLQNPIAEEKNNLFPFLVFAEKMKTVEPSQRETDFVDLIWNDIEALYSELRYWYADLDKYHTIGFLIACGTPIQRIRKTTEQLRKSEVQPALIGLIKNDIRKIEWDNLTYTQRSIDREKLKKILLLFNIATLVCKSEKQYRFPFDLYKKGEWDLEHIHAVKDDLPHSANDTATYLSALSEEFIGLGKEDAAKQINDFLLSKNRADKNFRSACVEFYEHLKGENQEELSEDNDIRNITLLNSEINRGYGNVTFMQKRKTIIKREGQGIFIPLCTKNVFLKYYNIGTLQNENWLRWNEHDREDYVRTMQSIVETFLSGGVTN